VEKNAICGFWQWKIKFHDGGRPRARPGKNKERWLQRNNRRGTTSITRSGIETKKKNKKELGSNKKNRHLRTAHFRRV